MGDASMIRNLLTASTILLLVPLVASAESGFVEGAVFNKRTGAPLENAVVTLTSFDGVCNARGFALPCIP
jgi:hypothetical protein